MTPDFLARRPFYAAIPLLAVCAVCTTLHRRWSGSVIPQPIRAP